MLLRKDEQIIENDVIIVIHHFINKNEILVQIKHKTVISIYSTQIKFCFFQKNQQEINLKSEKIVYCIKLGPPTADKHKYIFQK